MTARVTRVPATVAKVGKAEIKLVFDSDCEVDLLSTMTSKPRKLGRLTLNMRELRVQI